jgi:hypothetical protein
MTAACPVCSKEGHFSETRISLNPMPYVCPGCKTNLILGGRQKVGDPFILTLDPSPPVSDIGEYAYGSPEAFKERRLRTVKDFWGEVFFFLGTGVFALMVIQFLWNGLKTPPNAPLSYALMVLALALSFIGFQLRGGFSRGLTPAKEAPGPDQYVSTVSTSRGAVIITWHVARDRSDIRYAIATQGDAAVKPVTNKLREILTAHPNTELKKYETPLGIKLIDVERSWLAADTVAARFAQVIQRVTSLVELQKIRSDFLANHPEVAQNPELLEDIDMVFQAHKASLML